MLYAGVLFVTTIVSAIEATDSSTNAELPHVPHVPLGMSYDPLNSILSELGEFSVSSQIELWGPSSC